MNALTPINVFDATPLDPPWKRYLPAVEALRAGSSPRERALRAGLMLQRDLAGACRRETSSAEAGQAYLVLEQIAGEHCLSDMPELNLYALSLALAKMREAAVEIDAATQRDG